MAERFAAGGRLFTFGNGGSATDAEAVAHLYTEPPWGRALPARSLAEDQAVMTALGNDVGFELVFSRQLIAHGRADDIAMGFSTSGNSDNLMRAFAEARKQGMLTVGIAGTDGGRWPPKAARSSSASWSAPTASTASRSPRPPSTTPCGPRSKTPWPPL